MAPTYDGSGSVYALGLRLTKLDGNGVPVIGADNCYTTTALVKIELGLEYEDAKEVTQLNGSGDVCIEFQAPYTLKRGTISGLQICQPDPNILQFLIGGDIINDSASPTPNQIGYRAPQTGVEEVPNGVAIEAWSRAIIGSNWARTLPYLHWSLPQCYLQPTGTLALAADGSVLPELEGYSIQNAGFGTGPLNDIATPTDRVWQYVRESALPDLTQGFTTVVVQTPPTLVSIAITPANPSIAHTGTIQLTATGTWSNGTMTDVTSTATWTSGTTADATVGTTGLVTGVAAGSSVITATSGGVSGHTTVTLT
jgi:uncharacterized protein YjdB